MPGSIRQPPASCERTIADVRHIIRNCNACQVLAFVERPVPNTYHTVWDRDAGESGTPPKRLFSDICYALGNYYIRQPIAFGKGFPLDVCHMVWYCDAGQAAAAPKRLFANTCNAIGQRYAIQKLTSGKCPPAQCLSHCPGSLCPLNLRIRQTRHPRCALRLSGSSRCLDRQRRNTECRV